MSRSSDFRGGRRAALDKVGLERELFPGNEGSLAQRYRGIAAGRLLSAARRHAWARQQ
jgi:hypothetical protein